MPQKLLMGAGLGAAAALATAGLVFANQASSSPQPVPFNASTACHGGNSGGMDITYEPGGGDDTAAAAMARVVNIVKQGHPNTALTPRPVSWLDDEQVTQFATSSGAVLGEGVVAKVGQKWQIESIASCAE